jgi:RNA polymerase sigma-70 factor (ECF subfamily)
MKKQKPNKKIFSELIIRNQGLIHKITLIYIDNPADREDLFQEICLQLWKSYPNFRQESKFSTWMYRVALNTAISNVRKQKTRVVCEPLANYRQVEAEPDESYDNVLQLYAAVSKLNQIDKAIILLWLEEKSYEEIASITGLSKSNVSVKLMRIKKKLEEMISKTIEEKS